MVVADKKNSGGPWMIGVVGLCAGFVLFILICVFIASRQDYHLVAEDYYERGLSYQDRIDRRDHTDALDTELEISYSASAQEVTILYPPNSGFDSLDGEIVLYRPSNARWDQGYAVEPDSNLRQVIGVEKLPPGLWRIKVDWNTGQQRFYSESAFVLER